MHHSILLRALLALATNIHLSTSQVPTTTASTASRISPSPLTTTFLPASTPPPASSQSPDPWQCATKNLTQYFDVPKPIPTLLSALESYGDELLKPCLATATGLDILSCSVTETTQWCGFATAAEPVVQRRYSSYGSAAASWYAAKSAAIESVKTECRVTWEKFGPLDQAWLNQTVAHARCYEEAHPRVSGSSSVVSTVVTAKGT